MRSHSARGDFQPERRSRRLRRELTGGYRWSREQGEPPGSVFQPGNVWAQLLAEPLLPLHGDFFCKNGIERQFPRLQQ